MGVKILKSVNFGRRYIGLSTIGYTLETGAGAVLVPRTTDGVYEVGTDTGIYAALIDFSTQEVIDITFTADVGGSLGGKYFLIYDAAGVKYKAWFNVDSSSTEPEVISSTSIAINIASDATATTVATAAKTAIDALAPFTASVSTTIVTITVNDSGPVTDAEDGTLDSAITINITQGTNIENANVLWDTGTSTEELPLRYATEQYNRLENNPRTDDLWNSMVFLTAMTAGRWSIDEATKQMIFYSDDNTTVIARFNLFGKDGLPSYAAVFSRIRNDGNVVATSQSELLDALSDG